MQLDRHFLQFKLMNLLEPKRPDQADLSERYGRPELGLSNHPYTKESGRKGASNVQEDEIAGSE